MSTTEKSGKERILFRCSKDGNADKYLRGNPVSLLCTNINSMMGGRHNMWENGRTAKSGLVDVLGKPFD
jgi:hypothetical protein